MNKDLLKRTAGEELWLYRRYKNLTAAQMAGKLGVGRTTYWTWERDLQQPPNYVLPRYPNAGYHRMSSLLLVLARRRRGGTLADTAASIGCSHMNLLKREREADPELRAWWERKGFIF